MTGEEEARGAQTPMLKKKLAAMTAARRSRALAPEDIQAMNLQLRAAGLARARPIVIADPDPTDSVIIFDIDPTDSIVVIEP
jgi:hypothetical protein